MLQDLQPIIYNFGNEDIQIIPVFDLHVGSREFDEQRLQKFIEEIKDEPNVYLVIGGDLMDNGICAPALPFEQAMRPSEQKKYLCETLKPVKDRILCGCAGNHEYRSRKLGDECPLYDVFAKLDIEDRFRENACFVFLRFKDRSTMGSHRPFYSMMVTHGSGGGMLIGTGANKQERFATAIDNLDILITGHTHKPMAFPVCKLKIDGHNNQVIQQRFTCVTATSWMNYGGYALRKMLPPSATCEQRILLKANTKDVRVLMG